MQQQLEEDFASMLEYYIDDQKISQIVEEDEREEQRSKKRSGRSTESKFPMSIAISIKDYVEYYLGISSLPSVETVERTKYKKGKKVVVGTSTKINYDTLWHHGLIIDARGNRGTYVNPIFIRQLIESEDIESELKQLRRTGIHELELLEEYIRKCTELQLQYDATKDQNRKTLEVFKENRKIKKYYEIREELKKNA